MLISCIDLVSVIPVEYVFNKLYKDKIDLELFNNHINISVSKVTYDMKLPFVHLNWQLETSLTCCNNYQCTHFLK